MAGQFPRDDDQFDDLARRGAFMLALRARGVYDKRVLGAIESVPRGLFLPAAAKPYAFDDRPLPIDCGQSISAPSILAIMLQAADLRAGQRVLDIGTGSGYAAAVMAHLVGQVYTIDRYKTLIDLARDRFLALRLYNVIAECRDGLEGWAEQAPFDRILVNAATPDIPPILLASLKPGGILILPVGPAAGTQSLTRVTQSSDAATAPLIEGLTDVRFISLTPGRAGNL